MTPVRRNTNGSPNWRRRGSLASQPQGKRQSQPFGAEDEPGIVQHALALPGHKRQLPNWPCVESQWRSSAGSGGSGSGCVALLKLPGKPFRETAKNRGDLQPTKKQNENCSGPSSKSQFQVGVIVAWHSIEYQTTHTPNAKCRKTGQQQQQQWQRQLWQQQQQQQLHHAIKPVMEAAERALRSLNWRTGTST